MLLCFSLFYFIFLSHTLVCVVPPPPLYLFPSPPSSSLASNIFTHGWTPPSWHSDCSYRLHQLTSVHVSVTLNTVPFTQLHLIFSHPFLLRQPSLSAEVCACFFLSLVFFSILHLSFHLSKRAFQRLLVICITFISVRTCKHRKEWKIVTDWLERDVPSIQ